MYAMGTNVECMEYWIISTEVSPLKLTNYDSYGVPYKTITPFRKIALMLDPLMS